MNQAEAAAVSKFQPSSSSSTMNENDLAPQPLFVSLQYPRVPCIRILQLESPPPPPNEGNTNSSIVDPNEYVAFFNLDKLKGTSLDFISSPPGISTSVMYMIPDHGLLEEKIPLRGFEFNLTTGECRQSKPLTGAKRFGISVNCRGHIYILEDLDYYTDEPHPTFECYDPHKDAWDALPPFPIHATGEPPEGGDYGAFPAFAVWRDTILFNLDERQLWAYNVSNKKWYRVQARDGDNDEEENRCYTIYGRAIVIRNSIYALSLSCFNVILELSIQCIPNDDDDLVYICSLSSEMRVPGIEAIGYMNGETYMWARELVHLGEDNFCVVQSSRYFGKVEFQPIYVTHLKLKELEGGRKSMTLTNKHTYEVELDRGSQFVVEICFSLPKYKTMCKTEHGLIYNFEFDLKAEGLKPVHASTRGGDDKKGNLPPDATEEQLVKELKKFGPIKGDGVWGVNKNETGECYACVEFESATSKTCAIEASTIKIGGGCAEMEEKTIAAPLKQLTPAGQVAQGEVSSSKTTSRTQSL